MVATGRAENLGNVGLTRPARAEVFLYATLYGQL